ncbi:hypothetical protein HAX54_037949, partial [Datura stramonium]|nr:hypothetical protein [Datura stramonium]
GIGGCQLDDRPSLVPLRIGPFSLRAIELVTDRQMTDGPSWQPVTVGAKVRQSSEGPSLRQISGNSAKPDSGGDGPLGLRRSINCAIAT